MIVDFEILKKKKKIVMCRGIVIVFKIIINYNIINN